MLKNKKILFVLFLLIISISSADAVTIKYSCSILGDGTSKIKCSAFAYDESGRQLPYDVTMKCESTQSFNTVKTGVINIPGNCGARGSSGISYTVQVSGDTAIVEFTSSKGVLTESSNPVSSNGVEISGVSGYGSNKVTVNVSRKGDGCFGTVSMKGTISKIDTMCHLGQNMHVTIDMSGGGVSGGSVSASVNFNDETGKCGAVSEKCCTEGESLSPDKTFVKHDITNCCREGTESIAEQYNLNELFCDDKEVQAEHYYPKCNSDNWKDKEINEFCDLYCTQRVFVDAPGASGDYGPVNAGRYFSLPTSSHGTTSPYMEGAKRCRVRTKYSEWNTKLDDLMNQQVKAYNDYQDASINIKHIQEDQNPPKISYATVSATCTDSSGDNLGTESITISYKTITWKPAPPECNKIPQIKLTHDESHTKMILEENGTINVKDQPAYIGYIDAKRSWDYSSTGDKSATGSGYCEIIKQHLFSKYPELNSTNGINCECEGEDSVPEFNDDTPEKRIKAYEDKLKAAEEVLETTTLRIKEMKEDMTACLTYYDEKEVEYDFNPSYSFYYTQVYNSKGKLELKKDELMPGDPIIDDKGTMDYEQAQSSGLNLYSSPKGGTSQDIYPDLYSALYGSGIENIGGLTGYSMNCNKAAIEQSIDPYEKKFEYDRVRYINVSWNLTGVSNFKTQYPSGNTDGKGTDNNNIYHSGELPTNKADLDGTYLIGHLLSNIGENGIFDSAFESGTACTGEPASSVAPLTCRLTVKHSLITTGKCNNVTGNDSDNNNPGSMYRNCILEEVGNHRLFIFQLVDPENPFPNDKVTEKGEIAANWSDDDITNFRNENSGNNAYSPENLTYSFELTPETIGQIREYNNSQSNGYGDYDLVCETCQSNKDKTCSKCISKFLTELARSSWTGNGSIDDLRNNSDGWRENK